MWWLITLLSAAMADTFVVNTPLDTVDAAPSDAVCADATGRCSLRAAIMTANVVGPSTIELPAGTLQLQQVGDDDVSAVGDLDVQTNLEIVGVGAAPTRILGDQDRIFDVHGTSTLTLVRLDLANGSTDREGGCIRAGILHPGNGLVLDRVRMRNCTSGSSGGAIYARNGIDAERLVVRDSHAVGGGGGVFVAGDEWTVSGDASFRQAHFEGCTSDGTAGAAGFELVGASFADSTITGNSAVVRGGGLYLSDDSLSVRNTTITGNDARFGGGLYVNSLTSVDWVGLLIQDSIVTRNSAEYGGGLGVGGYASVDIDRTLFRGNTASSWGGGVSLGGYSYYSANLNQVSIVDNRSGGDAGGIGLGDYNSISITNSTIARNHADGAGGGIHAYGLGVTLRHLTIVNNTSHAPGAGLYVSRDEPVLVDSLLAGNTTGGEPSDCLGVITSRGGNLVQMEDATAGCSGVLGTDMVGTAGAPMEPLLGRLQIRGTVAAYPLLPGSPAIDAATGTTAVDIRGAARPVDGDGDGVALPDIGSFERSAR